MCDPPGRNKENFIAEENPKPPAALTGPGKRSWTNLERRLLQRGPPGWGWLLRPPLQLVPVRGRRGKNTIKTTRIKFEHVWRMYLPPC